MEILFWTGVAIIVASFMCEYVDATVGMGYGTTLVPLLLLLKLSPGQVVPAILFSQLICGLLAGFFHHREGNVDFAFNRSMLLPIRKNNAVNDHIHGFRRALSLHAKIVLILAGCSIFGTTASVVIAINLPGNLLKLTIGIMITLVGVVLLLLRNRAFVFSWRKIVLLGSVAAFNKGMSGGGYGPVVTGGQLLAGLNGKNAVGITSLSEGLTCITGVTAYLACGGNMDWRLLSLVVGGAVLSVPLSAVSVRKLSTEKMKTGIALITLVLGTVTIIKAL